MCKEQRPLRAEEWIKTKDVEFYLQDGTMCIIYDLMEQYTQYREKKAVLEALEPQKELIEELLTIFDGNGVPNIMYVTELIKDYYETQVKPKYK